MKKDMSFSEYLYRIENVADEFVIALLSFGAVIVAVWSLLAAPDSPNVIEFGRIIEPWITMLALMLIARELWLFNRYQSGGED